jgi:hypothetical protein
MEQKTAIKLFQANQIQKSKSRFLVTFAFLLLTFYFKKLPLR